MGLFRHFIFFQANFDCKSVRNQLIAVGHFLLLDYQPDSKIVILIFDNFPYTKGWGTKSTLI